VMAPVLGAATVTFATTACAFKMVVDVCKVSVDALLRRSFVSGEVSIMDDCERFSTSVVA
jgi:hypothetical protein